MSENGDLIQDELVDDISEKIEQPNESEAEGQETEAESAKVDEKPKSTYLDIDKLPEEHRDAVKNRINELYRKSMVTDRLEAKIKELEAKLEAKQEPIKTIEQPSWNLAIDNPAEFERLNNEFVKQQRELALKEAQDKANADQLATMRAQQLNQKANLFAERAQAKNIDLHKLDEAANFLVNVGLDTLGDLILDDEQGPELLNYLHTNIAAVEDLRGKDIASTVKYIERNIRPKLNQPKVSTPPPTTKVSGSRGAGSAPRDKYSFTIS